MKINKNHSICNSIKHDVIYHSICLDFIKNKKKHKIINSIIFIIKLQKNHFHNQKFVVDAFVILFVTLLFLPPSGILWKSFSRAFCFLFFMEIWSKTVAITPLIEVRKEVANEKFKFQRENCVSALLFKYLIYGMK